jgi:hypothetical protein
VCVGGYAAVGKRKKGERKGGGLNRWGILRSRGVSCFINPFQNKALEKSTDKSTFDGKVQHGKLGTVKIAGKAKEKKGHQLGR